MFTVGLTGGIGSGKSTVADLFAAHGAAIVDSDVIAHALTAPGGDAIPAIAEAFGPGVIAPDGRLDRGVMRTLAFSDPTARARLEAILHPMIRERSQAQARAAADAPYVMFVIPLLVESRPEAGRFDRILVVDCDVAVQVARVRTRSGLSEDQVRAIMAAQASRAERRAAADDLIDNSGRPEALVPQVGTLHETYCKLAHSRRHEGG